MDIVMIDDNTYHIVLTYTLITSYKSYDGNSDFANFYFGDISIPWLAWDSN